MFKNAYLLIWHCEILTKHLLNGFENVNYTKSKTNSRCHALVAPDKCPSFKISVQYYVNSFPNKTVVEWSGPATSDLRVR